MAFAPQLIQDKVAEFVAERQRTRQSRFLFVFKVALWCCITGIALFLAAWNIRAFLPDSDLVTAMAWAASLIGHSFNMFGILLTTTFPLEGNRVPVC